MENHKGQISFPGGSVGEKDADLKDTAFREAEEEIGLQAKDTIFLGRLDDVETAVSNFKISPFVAAVSYPYTFKINEREVDSIIEVPLKSFLANDSFYTIDEDCKIPGPHFRFKDKVIWGATARIMINFLTIVYPHDPLPGI